MTSMWFSTRPAALITKPELSVLKEVAEKLNRQLKKAIERLQKQAGRVLSNMEGCVLTRPDSSNLQYVEQSEQRESPNLVASSQGFNDGQSFTL